MITRREWLRRGATVVIGGSAVVIGQPTNAAPQPAPRSISVCGAYVAEPGVDVRHLIADLAFAPDGSFRVMPKSFDPDGTPGARDYVYGEPIVSGPNATARELIEALLAAARRP